MLTPVLLVTDEDLTHFGDGYAARSGFEVDLPYLKRSTVRGFTEAGGALVAGYVICATRPLRYLEVVPLSLEELVGAHRADQTCEGTCIWIDRSVSDADRLGIYLRAWRDMRATGKRYIIGASNHPGIARIQMQGLPEPLFSGQVELAGKTRDAWVYGGTMWTWLLGILRATPARLWRAVRRRRRTPAGASRSTPE